MADVLCVIIARPEAGTVHGILEAGTVHGIVEDDLFLYSMPGPNEASNAGWLSFKGTVAAGVLLSQSNEIFDLQFFFIIRTTYVRF